MIRVEALSLGYLQQIGGTPLSVNPLPSRTGGGFFISELSLVIHCVATSVPKPGEGGALI